MDNWTAEYDESGWKIFDSRGKEIAYVYQSNSPDNLKTDKQILNLICSAPQMFNALMLSLSDERIAKSTYDAAEKSIERVLACRI